MTITRAVLSQGEPRHVAVNFDTYQILQRHRPSAVSLPHGTQRGFLVYISDHTNDEITHITLIFTAVTQNHAMAENHGTRPKSW